jgi:hypothetical protein
MHGLQLVPMLPFPSPTVTAPSSLASNRTATCVPRLATLSAASGSRCPTNSWSPDAGKRISLPDGQDVAGRGQYGRIYPNSLCAAFLSRSS